MEEGTVYILHKVVIRDQPLAIFRRVASFLCRTGCDILPAGVHPLGTTFGVVREGSSG